MRTLTKFTVLTAALLGLFLTHGKAANSDSNGLRSIDTGYTITNVRTAVKDKTSYIVASSYEGTVLGISYDGRIVWNNPLSGFMNRDLWCEDITGDGSAEILAANADGTLYCLDGKGKLQWKFKMNDAPMYAVCVVHDRGTPYVVCGGFDKNIYYLSAAGKLVKTIPSSDYSVAKPWGEDAPPQRQHVANFLRPIVQADGTEALLVHGSMNGMQDRGVIYLFKPLENKPFSKSEKVPSRGPIGDLRVLDPDRDGAPEILMGASSMIQDACLIRFTPSTGEMKELNISTLKRGIDNFGYRVVQAETIPDGNGFKYLVLFGSRILLVPPSLDAKGAEILTCKYSFNDLWRDPLTGNILLASAQSGGSCVHVIDPKNPGWKAAYAALNPPGKIAAILANTKASRDRLASFKAPAWERPPLPVYLMSENTESVQGLVDDLKSKYQSPVFLNGFHSNQAEKFDRSTIANEFYRKRTDRRRKYDQTQEQALAFITPHYKDEPGVAYWAGHGNDPFMYRLETTKKVLDAANGKKTVLIYPELENHGPDFVYVLEELIYPLADYARNKNANIYVRTKNIFWQGVIYLPIWQRLLSGEFASVFVPAMEETTDKTMELSIAGRLGIWTSGAVDSWGTRCARDNPSFDRSRQHSHQMLPNHFLRTMVYHVSYGAQFLDNFNVDQKYMSFLWELIAKGALYVPKRSEIVSFSPVHLAMKTPDERYLDEGSNVKWSTYYDEEAEKKNPMVFSRMNGSWPGAAVTAWDFSRYAAGVTERRLNFLAPYQNGMVLIAPPQAGKFAASNPPRGAMTSHLNPIYKGILKEYITDGRNYYSTDGKETYPANEYYKNIEADIKASANKLPLTVTGDVAWVAAQTSPTHLRLTLIDSGYINPHKRTATVSFHTVKPVKMIDLLNGESFAVSNPSSVTVEVPCGLFRFIDIELKEALR